MKTRSKWTTLAIVIATVAIVFAPVFIPRETARWYLAAAANAYRVGDEALAENYLAKAMAWDGNIVEDGDFLVTQLSKSNWRSVDEQLDLLEKVVQTDPRWSILAREFATLLVHEFDFQHAVRALKIGFPGGEPSNAEELNQLAYYRSLAGIELKEALQDIERAIDLAGPAPAMLDTKAWVLHSLGRDLEALPIINDAVAGMERALGRSATSGSSTEAAKPPSKDNDSKDNEPSSEAMEPTSMWPDLVDVKKRIETAQKKLGPEMWSLAVLRFHRLRIYEAVGGRPEARQDRQWLREHGVPIADEVF
jgi:tetratricopeptide (TPR) repeat protein